MAGIFISYRREEASGHAGRLYDVLSRRFGEDQVFMDLSIEPGVDFAEQINEAVGSCRLLIAVIGPHWANMQDPDGRHRLDRTTDFVRIEIEAGLRRPEVRVVPVLVQGAQMPTVEELPPSLADLSRRNALELSDARWSFDVGRLTSTVERVLGVRARPSGISQRPQPQAGPTETGAERSAERPPPAPTDQHLHEPPATGAWFKRHLRLAISLTVIVVAAGMAAAIFAGASSQSGHEIWKDSARYVSPDRIELSGLVATGEHSHPKIGDRVKIEFSLKNVRSSPVTLDETFIAARDAGRRNVDFAEENQGRLLAPGEAVEINRSIVVAARGVWEFWPCYYIAHSGGECPDKWRSFQVSVGQ